MILIVSRITSLTNLGPMHEIYTTATVKLKSWWKHAKNFYAKMFAIFQCDDQQCMIKMALKMKNSSEKDNGIVCRSELERKNNWLAIIGAIWTAINPRLRGRSSTRLTKFCTSLTTYRYSLDFGEKITLLIYLLKPNLHIIDISSITYLPRLVNVFKERTSRATKKASG